MLLEIKYPHLTTPKSRAKDVLSGLIYTLSFCFRKKLIQNSDDVRLRFYFLFYH